MKLQICEVDYGHANQKVSISISLTSRQHQVSLQRSVPQKQLRIASFGRFLRVWNEITAV